MLRGPIRFTNAATGTADFIYPGPAIDMQSPASAGAVDGATYTYYAQSLDMVQWEIGQGVYTLSSGTFARTTILANSLGTTAKINFSNSPQVVVFDTAVAFALASDVAANTAAIAKLSNNQFGRVARATSNQSITVSVATKIQFNNTMFDPSGIWDGTNFRFKPTIAGYYRLSWSAQMTYTGGIYAYASMYFNGAIYAIGSLADDAPTFENSGGTAMAHFNGSTDYAEIFALIGSGSAGSVTAGTSQTYFEISLVKAD